MPCDADHISQSLSLSGSSTWSHHLLAGLWAVDLSELSARKEESLWLVEHETQWCGEADGPAPDTASVTEVHCSLTLSLLLNMAGSIVKLNDGDSIVSLLPGTEKLSSLKSASSVSSSTGCQRADLSNQTGTL